MKTLLLLAVIATAALAAQAQASVTERPVVVMGYPARYSAHPLSRSDVIAVIVAHDALSVEGHVVLPGQAVDYVNTLLKDKPHGVICVYLRPGLKFGEVVGSVDLLRETEAKTIALSRAELPFGQEP